MREGTTVAQETKTNLQVSRVEETIQEGASYFGSNLGLW